MSNTSKMVKNSSARRIKYLVLMQIGDKIRDIKTGNKKKLIFKLFLGTLLSVAISAGLSVLLSFIHKYFSFRLGNEMLATVLLFTQIFGIISCSSSMLSVLYTSKENTILLAFPCKYNEIFVSKIIVFALDELKKSIFFVLPFLIGYGIASTHNFVYWLLMVPSWIMLCLFPVLIGSALSIGLIYIKKFLEKHTLIYALFIVAMISGLLVATILVLSKVPTPVRLIAKYGKFMNMLNSFFTAVNQYALWYNFFGKVLFGIKIYIYLPILLAIFIASACLCFFVAMPFYFKAASSSSEHSKNKVRKQKKTRLHGLFFTFLRKEILLLLRTPTLINSAITMILFFPVIIYVMNFIVAAINTNQLGDYLTVAFNVMITLSLLSTHNASCAMAISSEGNEFAVLKTSPSKTMVISWAKVTLTAILNIIAIIVMMVVIGFNSNLKAVELVLVGVLVMLCSLGHIFWSIQMDITNPKITEYATKGDAVVDNTNVAKSIVFGFVIATLAGFLSLLMLLDNYLTGWVRLILIALGFFLARLYLYQSNLKVYFDEIQM